MNNILDLMASSVFTPYKNMSITFSTLVQSPLTKGDVILLRAVGYQELYYFNGYVFIRFNVVDVDYAWADRYTPLEVTVDSITANYNILGNWQGEVE